MFKQGDIVVLICDHDGEGREGMRGVIRGQSETTGDYAVEFLEDDFYGHECSRFKIPNDKGYWVPGKKMRRVCTIAPINIFSP